MTVDPAEVTRESRVGAEPTVAELIDRLILFEGPPEQFLQQLLIVQCQIASVGAGVVLRVTSERGAEVLAVNPQLAPGATPPVWLAQAVESASSVIAQSRTDVRPVHAADALYGEPARRHLIMLPIKGATGVAGVAAFLLETRDPTGLVAAREKLELTTSLLSLYEMRLTVQHRQWDLKRLRMAMETLTAVNEQDRFAGATMAMVNEVAARWQCERAALGFHRGRYVYLAALSHTEKFSRKQKLVQDLEAAMEESLDQDVEVVYPLPENATYVARAAAELTQRQGPTSVVSLPLRRGGEPVAVLTVERAADRALATEEIETLRLACELCTARLVNLHDNDRWFGARTVSSVRKGLAALVGPKHTGYKVAGIGIAAALVFLIFAKGEYTVEAPFVLEATQRQVVPAPFDGYLDTVSVKPGDAVKADDELARLDTTDLRLQLMASQAERNGYLTQVSAAMRDEKTAEAQVAQAQAGKAAAQMKLLEYRISQARIASRIDGVVLTGDLERQLGVPVKTGDVLFEVAPVESLRAELSVPEDQIPDVHQSRQTGELAVAAYPGRRIRFTVERVNPVAEVVNQRNVFKVRVRLEPTDLKIRPGMEGVARVSVERRRYVWIWSRSLVNWIRMRLWWGNAS